MDLSMIVVREGVTEKGAALTVGMKVNYISILPGGKVKLAMPDYTVHVASQSCFVEFD